MSVFSQTRGGKLIMIIGPMFSGKTTSLISELTRYIDLEIPVAYINSSDDTRSDYFSTHNSSLTQVSPKFETIKTKKLFELEDTVLEKFEVIAIDESQFFEDILNFVKKWLTKGKIIYVAGLDGDIEQKVFGDLVYLIPYATEVRKLNAVCELCRKEKCIVLAPFTIRKSESKEKVVIGGKDIYLPVCSFHLFQHENEEKKRNDSYNELKWDLSGLNFINYVK
jgi:thymidine kinase